MDSAIKPKLMYVPTVFAIFSLLLSVFTYLFFRLSFSFLCALLSGSSFTFLARFVVYFPLFFILSLFHPVIFSFFSFPFSLCVFDLADIFIYPKSGVLDTLLSTLLLLSLLLGLLLISTRSCFCNDY